MHKALYRKWRPANFDDVSGQEHITTVLKYETETGRFSHAYLFCGSRGTGKTTCAKILSKAVNCEAPINGSPCGKCRSCISIDQGTTTDVLEMDAASNNGVDNIRDIRNEVGYTPSELKYRVYIVDEVHMLSPSAFNALLKTLEEPPSHVIFILATTELQKLPATIVSRCQRFDFRRISTGNIASRIKLIADSEGINITDGAAQMIARYAQGGMRDAISLLELCSGGGSDVDEKAVIDATGSTGSAEVMKVIRAISAGNCVEVLDIIGEIADSSKDIAVFWQELIGAYRNMLVVKTAGDYAGKYFDLTPEEEKDIRLVADGFSREKLISHSKRLEEAYASMIRAGQTRKTTAEIALIRMCDPALDPSYEALADRIAQLEDMIAGGAIKAAVRASTEASADMSAEKKTKKKSNAAEGSSDTAEERGSSEATKNATVAAATVGDKTLKDSTKGTVRQLGCWQEAIEKLYKVEVVAASFLKNARAFELNGKVTVITDNSFTVGMVNKPSTRDSLRTILSSLMGTEIKDRDLVIDYREIPNEADDSAIDEILKNISEEIK